MTYYRIYCLGTSFTVTLVTRVQWMMKFIIEFKQKKWKRKKIVESVTNDYVVSITQHH